MPPPDAGWSRIATVPNALSLLRLLLIPVFVAVTLQGKFALAFFLFVGTAGTDALDGWIARRFNQRSRLGTFLDPAADKTMMVTTYIVYTMPWVAEWRLPVWLTFTVFIRDITIVIFAYLLYTRISIRRFPPSIAGKTSTVIQVVALAATISANMWLAPLTGWMVPWLHRLALVTTLYSGFDYMRRWDLVLQREARG